jgi:outer membrane receptor for ferrienterochelin and colicin
MKHKIGHVRPVAGLLYAVASALFLSVTLLAVPVAGYAQETSSTIRGVVTDENGNRVANATVTVVNETTGLSRTTTTNEAGEYRVRNLPIGTNYSVLAEGTGFGPERFRDLSVNLGQTANADFVLSRTEAVEEIVVLGQVSPLAQVAVGPSATFSLEQLQSVPAINRNISDVIRIDPRMFVDESRGDINAVQCGGKNSRFNALTVDGVRLNDSFGLNSNGFPTERMPFSYDAISQVAVELAPFDVEYGGFSACNINAVTKSGGNTFTGSAFYDYTSNDLRGDSLEGDSIETGDYTEDRYGITFGGPIIQDRLFFFAAYEKLEGANLFDRGPLGSGAVNEINVSQADLDEIVRIANDLYLYDPGTIPASAGNEDEKFLLKLDWNINDLNRVAFTYTYNDGFNISESDSGGDEFEFSNHLYERGAELNSYVGTLYSDWTDSFSTEFRAGYQKLENRQLSLGGTDFGEMHIDTGDVTVYIGGDDSRQSNVLEYDVMNLAFKGEYFTSGGHNLTFGVERENLEIFNLFVQHTETEIRFSSIADFEAGTPNAIYYNNAPSNNPTDAAADWGYALNTAYIQDEFPIGDRLTLIAGVRYDLYTTSDEPAENPDFVADYGFSNSATLDGEGLIQPRLGFTLDLADQTTLRGGVGLYSGGNPNVWLSNNYSANNVLQFGQRGRSFGYTDGSRSLFDADVVYEAIEPNAPAGAGPGWGIPSELFNAVAGGVGDNFEINYLDPNFSIPSEWKFALGVTHIFPREYIFTADLLVTRGQNSAIVLRGDIEQVGTTAEGYPVYDSVREPSFVLTNSTKGNDSIGISTSLTKEFDNGFDFAVGYAWTDAEDVQPMTSSVAFSNYTNRTFFDPQEDVQSTSNYSIEHRITATATWRKAFFGDYLTTVSLYGQANSGAPYSIAFDGTIDPYNFTPFLDFQPRVLEPGVERNAETGSWWRKVDFRVAQEFPGFSQEHRASAFLVIDNLTNLLNDDWGILRQHNFPFAVEAGTPEPRIGDASRYEIRIGAQYEF